MEFTNISKQEIHFALKIWRSLTNAAKKDYFSFKSSLFIKYHFYCLKAKILFICKSLKQKMLNSRVQELNLQWLLFCWHYLKTMTGKAFAVFKNWISRKLSKSLTPYFFSTIIIFKAGLGPFKMDLFPSKGVVQLRPMIGVNKNKGNNHSQKKPYSAKWHNL